MAKIFNDHLQRAVAPFGDAYRQSIDMNINGIVEHQGTGLANDGVDGPVHKGLDIA